MRHEQKSFNIVQVFNEYINTKVKEVESKNKNDLSEIKKRFTQVYDKIKLRNKEHIDSKLVLNLFAESSRMLRNSKYLSQVHHFNMAQMIHPHWGYLCGFKVRRSFLLNYHYIFCFCPES